MWLHVYEQFPYDSSDWFTHIIQGFVIGTGTIVGVPQPQFGNPNRYGKIVSTRPQQKQIFANSLHILLLALFLSPLKLFSMSMQMKYWQDKTTTTCGPFY